MIPEITTADLCRIVRRVAIRKIGGMAPVLRRTEEETVVHKAVTMEVDAVRMAEIRTAEIRTAEDRTVIRVAVLRDAMMEADAARMAEIRKIEDRTVVHKAVSRDRTEEQRTMADLPLTDKTAAKGLRDLALKVARVNAAWAVAARIMAVVSAVMVVIAAMAEAMVDREIDSEVSRQIRALYLKPPQRILRRSARKKRDASVRKKTSATAKT